MYKMLQYTAVTQRTGWGHIGRVCALWVVKAPIATCRIECLGALSLHDCGNLQRTHHYRDVHDRVEVGAVLLSCGCALEQGGG